MNSCLDPAGRAGNPWANCGKSRPDYFEGIFHGNGYTIRHLHIDRNTRDYLGLFSAIGESRPGPEPGAG